MPNKTKYPIMIVSFHEGKEEQIRQHVRTAKIPETSIQVLGMQPRTEKHFIEKLQHNAPKVLLIDAELHGRSIMGLLDQARPIIHGNNMKTKIFLFGEKPNPQVIDVEFIKDFSRVPDIISKSVNPKKKAASSL